MGEIMRYPAPVEAAQLGHDLEWDPGRYPRYTCTRCGAGTLKVTTFWYGSAVETACAPAEAPLPERFPAEYEETHRDR